MASERARRRGWIVCFTSEVLALSIWIGGLVVIVASVIPAVFNSFGMEQGGRFLARVFDGYNRLTAVAVVVLVSTAVWRFRAVRSTIPSDPGALARGRGPSRMETVLLVTMLLVTVLIAFMFGPQSLALQQQAFEAEGDAAKKAAYDAFFRTHLVVRGLYLLNLGVAVALLAMKITRWTGAEDRRASS